MGGAGPEEDAAAAAMWTAAADAMAWTASMREHDSWAELKGAWATKAEAVDAMRAGSEECGRAVDAQGAVDAGALGRAAEALRHAAAAIGRAAEAFDRSSDLCKAAGAEQRRAGSAYAQALNPGRTVDLYSMAIMSYDRAVKTDRMASNARGTAAGLAHEADEMAALAAKWEDAGGRWHGDRGGLAAVQADLWEEAKEIRAGSEEMKRNAAEAERLAARMRDAAARMAERSAARAAAVARDDPAGPDAQEAAEAWRKAMSEAHAADDQAAGWMEDEEGGGA